MEKDLNICSSDKQKFQELSIFYKDCFKPTLSLTESSKSEKIDFATGSCFQYIFSTLLTNKKKRELFCKDSGCQVKGASIKRIPDREEKIDDIFAYNMEDMSENESSEEEQYTDDEDEDENPYNIEHDEETCEIIENPDDKYDEPTKSRKFDVYIERGSSDFKTKEYYTITQPGIKKLSNKKELFKRFIKEYTTGYSQILKECIRDYFIEYIKHNKDFEIKLREISSKHDIIYYSENEYIGINKETGKGNNILGSVLKELCRELDEKDTKISRELRDKQDDSLIILSYKIFIYLRDHLVTPPYQLRIKDEIKTLKNLIDNVEQVKGFVSDIVLLEYYKKGSAVFDIQTIDYIKDILTFCYKNDELDTENPLTLLKCKVVDNLNPLIRIYLLDLVKKIVVKTIITHELQKENPEIKSNEIDLYINIMETKYKEKHAKTNLKGHKKSLGDWLYHLYQHSLKLNDPEYTDLICEDCEEKHEKLDQEILDKLEESKLNQIYDYIPSQEECKKAYKNQEDKEKKEKEIDMEELDFNYNMDSDKKDSFLPEGFNKELVLKSMDKDDGMYDDQAYSGKKAVTANDKRFKEAKKNILRIAENDLLMKYDFVPENDEENIENINNLITKSNKYINHEEFIEIFNEELLGTDMESSLKIYKTLIENLVKYNLIKSDDGSIDQNKDVFDKDILNFIKDNVNDSEKMWDNLPRDQEDVVEEEPELDSKQEDEKMYDKKDSIFVVNNFIFNDLKVGEYFYPSLDTYIIIHMTYRICNKMFKKFFDAYSLLLCDSPDDYEIRGGVIKISKSEMYQKVDIPVSRLNIQTHDDIDMKWAEEDVSYESLTVFNKEINHQFMLERFSKSNALDNLIKIQHDIIYKSLEKSAAFILDHKFLSNYTYNLQYNNTSIVKLLDFSPGKDIKCILLEDRDQKDQDLSVNFSKIKYVLPYFGNILKRLEDFMCKHVDIIKTSLTKIEIDRLTQLRLNLTCKLFNGLSKTIEFDDLQGESVTHVLTIDDIINNMNSILKFMIPSDREILDDEDDENVLTLNCDYNNLPDEAAVREDDEDDDDDEENTITYKISNNKTLKGYNNLMKQYYKEINNEYGYSRSGLSQFYDSKFHLSRYILKFGKLKANLTNNIKQVFPYIIDSDLPYYQSYLLYTTNMIINFMVMFKNINNEEFIQPLSGDENDRYIAIYKISNYIFNIIDNFFYNKETFNFDINIGKIKQDFPLSKASAKDIKQYTAKKDYISIRQLTSSIFSDQYIKKYIENKLRIEKLHNDVVEKLDILLIIIFNHIEKNRHNDDCKLLVNIIGNLEKLDGFFSREYKLLCAKKKKQKKKSLFESVYNFLK